MVRRLARSFTACSNFARSSPPTVWQRRGFTGVQLTVNHDLSLEEGFRLLKPSPKFQVTGGNVLVSGCGILAR